MYLCVFKGTTMIAVSKGKILIAEDERIIAWEMESMVMDLGYEVTAITSSGEDTVEKTKEELPDLILMNVKLKGEMDGIEAVQEIQSRYQIPVIDISAYSDEETVCRARGTSPFGYLDKPFRQSDLEIAIESALFRRA
jgi:CheY-like chemotaxis protein